MPEQVILVNKFDEEIGLEEKLKAHQEGKLHRAFSIFVLNSKGELLLQQRAGTKYHSRLLWANTCCSHPRPGEHLEYAVHRRLKEEMGFDCALKEAFSFIYEAELDRDLIEHEYDHVFVGIFDGVPKENKEEVNAWKWMTIDDLILDMNKSPSSYVYWLKTSIERVHSYILKNVY